MDSAKTECVTCGRKAVYHPQCGYAMAKLLERLIAEHYIRPERVQDLLERASNMDGGRGFFSNAELSAPTPTSEEDLLS